MNTNEREFLIPSNSMELDAGNRVEFEAVGMEAKV